MVGLLPDAVPLSVAYQASVVLIERRRATRRRCRCSSATSTSVPLPRAASSSESSRPPADADVPIIAHEPRSSCAGSGCRRRHRGSDVAATPTAPIVDAADALIVAHAARRAARPGLHGRPGRARRPLRGRPPSQHAASSPTSPRSCSIRSRRASTSLAAGLTAVDGARDVTVAPASAGPARRAPAQRADR